jgi:hypothetical protein
MTCIPCTTAGRYDFNCAQCCARLIRNARPHKHLQNAQIAAMARFHGPAWASMWADVKTLLGVA